MQKLILSLLIIMVSASITSCSGRKCPNSDAPYHAGIPYFTVRATCPEQPDITILVKLTPIETLQLIDGDLVWVNFNSMQIDNNDPTAMKCQLGTISALQKVRAQQYIDDYNTSHE